MDNIVFSQRTAQDRSDNPLSRTLARAIGPVLDLTVSNPTRIGLGIDPKILGSALSQGAQSPYDPNPLGLDVAREAVRDYYSQRGVAITSEQVILTATTSEAYLALFSLLADAGDRILVTRPSYPLIEDLARNANITPLPVSLSAEGSRWHIDPDAIDAGFASGARAAVLVSPNNPTGSLLSTVERRALVATAERHRAALISDEVFLDYLDEPERFATHSFARTTEIFTATLSGLSKVAGQPGLKLGWMVLNGPEALVTEARGRLEIWLDTFLSVATPVQHALPEILDATGLFQANVRDRRLENLTFLHEVCRNTAVTPSGGEGGWYAVLQLPAIMNDEAWATELVEHGAVRTLPGYLFDFEVEARLVVSLIVSPEDFEEGIGRILRHVDART